ncbi:MAG: SGNH/GDSL hydrolase family protein [Rhodothermales bacterium]
MRPSASSRRDFLKTAAFTAGAGIPIADIVASVFEDADDDGADFLLAADRVVLFQGDSITDAGREKEKQEPNAGRSLGNGYVSLAAAQLLAMQPRANWQCYNRGISGNKVYQLAERWEADCMDLQPHVLSILIGVNDFWHKLNGNYDGTPEIYERDYRALLDRTKAALPGVRLILCEPFAVEGGTAINETWHPEFDAYQAAAKRIADDYKAQWVPYQKLFDAALKKAPASYWCPDGVHPAPPGNYLMAEAWLKAFKKASR